VKRALLAVFVAQLLAASLAAQSPASALIAKGDALDRKLATREALAIYLDAEKLDPRNADLLRRIAKQYAELMPETTSPAAKREAGEKALAYAKRAAELDPRDAKVQLSLAICYGRLAPLLDNKTKIAYSKLVKQHVDAAIQLDPTDDYAWHVLGAWNYELANLNAVLRALAGAIYGRLPAASNERAVECFQKSIEVGPPRVSHHVELGRTYAAMGKKDLARAEITKGLALPSREKDDEETKARGREALKKL
jgi:tetratricopeptide (TPR) repeat protein